MKGNGDPKIVAELLDAAKNSLARGFSILAVEPHSKDPFTLYSPHAVNSCSRVPDIALKPWMDGHEANYGVGGGPSNITIIDVDKGIPNYTALQAWMETMNLPPTFTVQTGRDGEFGCHLYYSGAVATTPFNIDGVVGELRGVGAYVVGPGSIHPSGKKYVIINDVDIVPLPEGMVNMAVSKKKAMSEFKPGNELIPAGNRWAHLQVKAGVFKGLGLSYEGIYAALKNFCELNCEDGANYPDDKIQALAEWAGSDDCEAGEQSGIVTIGSADPEADTGIPNIPLATIEGDYIGDLALAITSGTFIPPSFARADLKTVLGAIMDGHIGFPGEETLHMRHWTGVVSSRPETGKSVCWERLMMLLAETLKKNDVKFPPAGFFSSGEHAVKVLSENDGKSHILYFDEMKTLFEKGNGTGSTLFMKLLELYEQKASAVGSLTHGAASFNNVSLSMAGNFTRAGFDRSVAGKGAGGDGFLSRMVLDYSDGMPYQGDWDTMDVAKINLAVKNISESLAWLINYKGEHNGIPFIPPVDDDAKAARIEFQKWLSQEKTRIQKEHPDSSYASRIEAHFKRDLLVRVAMTPERRITKGLVTRSWLWAKHQLMLREELWPVDMGGAVEKFEKRIITAINKKGPLTKSGAQKFSNAGTCDGGFEAWNRAWRNLLQADKIVVLNIKSDRGKEKFGFDDAMWNKTKAKWIFGNPNA